MKEFWETNFRAKQTMWGFRPVYAAMEMADLFHREGLKKILIPGFGYGRNAAAFADKGASVTGIEISATAIHLARTHSNHPYTIFHGSVNDMPFDEAQYDGIFCYALLHLLDAGERAQLLANCYEQLKPNGLMVFLTISPQTPAYGEGELLSEDRFLTKHGVKIFYYRAASIQQDFGKYGLIRVEEVQEPPQAADNRSSQRFWQIICRKESQAY
ncbi:MAG: class I SAM-dependent methyltransferase [Bacteroidota bacterium]